VDVKRTLIAVLILGLVLGVNVVGWMFYTANSAVVTIDLLGFMVLEVSVWKLTLGSFALGATLVGLVAGILALRGFELRRRYRKTIRQLESELHQLRSLPLSDSPQRPESSRAVVSDPGGQGIPAAASGRG